VDVARGGSVLPRLRQRQVLPFEEVIVSVRLAEAEDRQPGLVEASHDFEVRDAERDVVEHVSRLDG
jgi:hypothetical protein